MKLFVKRVLLGATLMLGAPAMAQDDSSADAHGGFVQAVETSESLIVRVPVDANGLEQVGAAEFRVAGDVGTSADLATAFASATDMSQAPVVSQDDINADSSTSGWRRGGYYGSPWQYNYYRGYQPSYYNYGRYYPYQYYSSRDYWYGGGYGYRYYYYRRCW